MNTPTRINVTWHTDNFEYRVDIPEWDGGEVVLASDYDTLRQKHEKALEFIKSVADFGQFEDSKQAAKLLEELQS